MAPGAYMSIYTPYNHTHTYARTYKYIYVGICCFYALFICFRGYHAICINCPNPLIYFTLLICLNTFPHDTVAVAFESLPFLHRHRACHGWNGCNGICPAFVYVYHQTNTVASTPSRDRIYEYSHFWDSVSYSTVRPSCGNGNYKSC